MRHLAVILSLVGTIGVPVESQPRHPVYLRYDGFVRNVDSSLTLAFGYHNLNQVDVTIEGGDNRFLAGAPNRRQPTVFLAGRHRFACVMVVPETLDLPLQWQVSFAGLTSITTAKMLDPRYALEEASAYLVVQGRDLGAAPPGVCLDQDITGNGR